MSASKPLLTEPQDKRFAEDAIPLESFFLASRRRDDEMVWYLRCPACHTWGEIDDDQFDGRVSVRCATENCSFHETHDFKSWLWRVYLPGHQMRTGNR